MGYQIIRYLNHVPITTQELAQQTITDEIILQTIHTRVHTSYGAMAHPEPTQHK